METLRDKLISIIKTLPEDRLQLIMDFINQMNQSNYQPEDFDELQMELEQWPASGHQTQPHSKLLAAVDSFREKTAANYCSAQLSIPLYPATREL